MKVRLLRDGQIETVNKAEMVALLRACKLGLPVRLRAESILTLTSSTDTVDAPIYAVPEGYEFVVRRVFVDLDENSDPTNGIPVGVAGGNTTIASFAFPTDLMGWTATGNPGIIWQNVTAHSFPGAVEYDMNGVAGAGILSPPLTPPTGTGTLQIFVWLKSASTISLQYQLREYADAAGTVFLRQQASGLLPQVGGFFSRFGFAPTALGADAKSFRLAVVDPNPDASPITWFADDASFIVTNPTPMHLAYLRSGQLIEYATPRGPNGAAQVPGIQTWGKEQGPYLANGEVFGVRVKPALAPQHLRVSVEGILQPVTDQ